MNQKIFTLLIILSSAGVFLWQMMPSQPSGVKPELMNALITDADQKYFNHFNLR